MLLAHDSHLSGKPDEARLYTYIQVFTFLLGY